MPEVIPEYQKILGSHLVALVMQLMCSAPDVVSTGQTTATGRWIPVWSCLVS